MTKLTIQKSASTSYKEQLVKKLLVAMYVAGVVGLQWELSRPLFEALVPFNLIVTAILLLYFHSEWNKKAILTIGLIALSGYWVEVAGVSSKVIFGSYEYGNTLGFKVLGVPLLIGLNWLTLIYSIGILVNQPFLNIFTKAFLGAVLMGITDLFIEPVAIKYDFWSWENVNVPLQNYIAWVVISFFLLLLFFAVPFRKKNNLAITVYLCQLFFFTAHYILEQLKVF